MDEPSTLNSSENIEGWVTFGTFALAAGILAASLFPTIGTGTESFFFRDYGLFGYPLAQYHRASFWQGEIPFWNPFNNCGLPFFAQWNTMVFYPLSLIYLLLPLPGSLGVFCLFHLWLAAVGMFVLARFYSGSSIASTAAGLGFAFGGLLLGSLKYPNNIAALGLMPWTIWSVEAAILAGGRSLIVAALIGGVQMLAGAPEIIALTWIYSGLRVLCSPLEAWRTSFFRLTLIVSVVALLCAAQLLPFLDLIAHSQRNQSFGDSQWSMPIWGWANFFVPLFHCFPSYHGVYAQPDQYWISSYYAPITLSMFAPLALRARNRRLTVFLALTCLIFLFLSFGDAAGFYRIIRTIVPGFNFMRFPIKFSVMLVFALTLLGSIGLAEAVRSVRNGLRHPIFPIGFAALGATLVIAALIGFAYTHPAAGENPSLTLQNGVSRTVLMAGAVSLLFASCQTAAAHVRVLLWLGLCGIIWIDAVSHGPSENPGIDASIYRANVRASGDYPRLGTGRAMISAGAQERLDHSQFATPAEDYGVSRLAVYADCNLLDAVPKVDGFFSLYLREESTIDRILYASTNYSFPGLMDFLCVTQISDPNAPTRWTKRTNSLPLIQSGGRIQFANREQTLRTLVSDEFDPRSLVLLPENARGLVQATNSVPAQIAVKYITAEKIAFSTTAPTNALVTISQSFHRGWHAKVDGAPVPIWRANHAFQAIEVPAGAHSVLLYYSEPFFAMGAIISALTLMGSAFVLIAGRINPSRRMSLSITA